MTEQTEIRTDLLSADGLATLLRLIVAQASLRVSRASVDGRLVWIKRYDVERMPLAKRLHSLVSPLLPVFLRSSPTTGSAEAIAREMRKLASFRAAGFAVPDVVFSNQSVLVLSDVGEVVQKTLVDSVATNPAMHDDLLVDVARALGEAHRAGLCHGRPHPRDMFLRDGGIGFLDFEEEPEAVMPLPMAQARDAWLLFLQISPRAALPDTQARALAAYRAAGSGSGITHAHDVFRAGDGSAASGSEWPDRQGRSPRHRGHQLSEPCLRHRAAIEFPGFSDRP